MLYSALAADEVLAKIAEQKEDVEACGGGPTDRRDRYEFKGASPAWLALEAAAMRREAMFKARLLRAAGEVELARMMKQQPDEFKELQREQRKKWETD
jgi:hypothetical protein